MSAHIEEPHIERLRRLIVEAYARHPTGCGGSFGEILCWEIHSNGQTFLWLAERWGITVSTLGELIADHCKRLEPNPMVRRESRMDGGRDGAVTGNEAGHNRTHRPIQGPSGAFATPTGPPPHPEAESRAPVAGSRSLSRPELGDLDAEASTRDSNPPGAFSPSPSERHAERLARKMEECAADLDFMLEEDDPEGDDEEMADARLEHEALNAGASALRENAALRQRVEELEAQLATEERGLDARADRVLTLRRRVEELEAEVVRLTRGIDSLLDEGEADERILDEFLARRALADKEEEG